MLTAVQTDMPFFPKTFHFRFSVRSLLVATTVLGVLLGLVGNEANRLRLHRQVVRKVHELGGRYVSVTGDFYELGWGPFWCPVIHDSLYADFDCVWFNSTANAGLRDEDLAILKHLPRLKDLQIAAPLVTDEALAHIEGSRSLRELTLYETQVTSRGLQRLRGISLEKLVLAGPAVTNETLEALEAFPALRKLMIAESSVTDVGLVHLEHVPNLEKLFLSHSPIGDPGISHLMKRTRLHELNLIDLAITDTGLLAFRNSHTLKYLFIGSQSSPDTLKTLTSALPDCQVSDSSGFRCMQGW